MIIEILLCTDRLKIFEYLRKITHILGVFHHYFYFLNFELVKEIFGKILMRVYFDYFNDGIWRIDNQTFLRLLT